MPVVVLSFLIGVVTGLRSMTAPAAVAWGAALGRVNSALAGLGRPVTAYVLTVLALGELIADKLPKTPSRKAPGPFLARVVVGTLCGAALAGENAVVGAIAGALGAVAGTLGGYEFRARLVRASGGKDLPIALLEDAIAIGGAIAIISQFP